MHLASSDQKQGVVTKGMETVTTTVVILSLLLIVALCAPYAQANQTESGLPEHDMVLSVDSQATSSSDEFFHVADVAESTQKTTPIATFLSKLGRVFVRKNEQQPDPDSVNSGPFLGPDWSKEKNTQVLESVSIIDAQQQTPIKERGFSLNAKPGYDAEGSHNGFRVLTKNNKSAARIFSVHHDWQELGDVLLPQEKWQVSPENEAPSAPINEMQLFESNGLRLGVMPSSANHSLNNVNSDANGLSEITTLSPNLVLAWSSPVKDQGGQYSVSAVGRKLSTQGYYAGQYVKKETYGWGVNLAGDWRYGAFQAGLSLAMGEAIESLLLPLNARDLYWHDNEFGKTQAMSVMPSIGFYFDNASKFQVALGRYQNNDYVQTEDTLDTIHVGYSWSAWSNSELGVELIDQKVQGNLGDLQSDQQIRFGLKHNF